MTKDEGQTKKETSVMSGIFILYVVGGVILALILIAVIFGLPSLMRYLRISKM